MGCLSHFRTHPRCQALADDIGFMVQARRITGLMFRTLSAKNWSLVRKADLDRAGKFLEEPDVTG
jgi:hypothetical protein